MLAASTGFLCLLPACNSNDRPVSPSLQVLPTDTPCGWPGNTCTPTFTWTFTPTSTPTFTPTCVGASGSLAAPVTYTTWSVSSGLIIARPVTVSGRVRITDIQLADYCTGSGNSLTVGIYGDSGSGYPAALVASTTGTGSGNCGGVNPVTFTFGSPVLLDPGPYWLAVGGSGTVSIWLGGTGTFSAYYYYPGSFGTFPSTYPSGSGYWYPPVLSADWICP